MIEKDRKLINCLRTYREFLLGEAELLEREIEDQELEDAMLQYAFLWFDVHEDTETELLEQVSGVSYRTLLEQFLRGLIRNWMSLTDEEVAALDLLSDEDLRPVPMTNPRLAFQELG